MTSIVNFTGKIVRMNSSCDNKIPNLIANALAQFVCCVQLYDKHTSLFIGKIIDQKIPMEKM